MLHMSNIPLVIQETNFNQVSSLIELYSTLNQNNLSPNFNHLTFPNKGVEIVKFTNFLVISFNCTLRNNELSQSVNRP